MPRKHTLCASILSWHASSPLLTMHSSRTVLVSGQAQQILHVGFTSPTGAAAGAEASGIVVAAAVCGGCASTVWRRPRSRDAVPCRARVSDSLFAGYKDAESSSNLNSGTGQRTTDNGHAHLRVGRPWLVGLRHSLLTLVQLGGNRRTCHIAVIAQANLLAPGSSGEALKTRPRCTRLGPPHSEEIGPYSFSARPLSPISRGARGVPSANPPRRGPAAPPTTP